MTTFTQPLIFVAQDREKHVDAVFDNQISLSCINPSYLKSLGISDDAIPAYHMPGTFCDDSKMTVPGAVRLEFYLNDVLLKDDFYVIPGLSVDAIIGASTIKKWHVQLDDANGAAFVDPRMVNMLAA